MTRIDPPDEKKKISTIPANSLVWGELFQEESGGVSFRFHVEEGAGGFDAARTVLKKFAMIVQRRLDRAEECPYYERGELNNERYDGQLRPDRVIQVAVMGHPDMTREDAKGLMSKLMARFTGPNYYVLGWALPERPHSIFWFTLGIAQSVLHDVIEIMMFTRMMTAGTRILPGQAIPQYLTVTETEHAPSASAEITVTSTSRILILVGSGADYWDAVENIFLLDSLVYEELLV